MLVIYYHFYHCWIPFPYVLFRSFEYISLVRFVSSIFYRLIETWFCCCSAVKWSLTLRDPMDCSPPSSSVHGVLQARILWVAISFSKGSSHIRNQTHVFCIGRWILYQWDTREALLKYNLHTIKFNHFYCPLQWILLNLQSCAAFTIIQF